MVGVRMTKSGKFWAQIKDPLKNRRVWLGGFDTAEEASRAYLAEESKLAAAAKLRAKQRVGWAASENSRFQGVWTTASGKFGSSIRDPFKKKTVWLGSFTTAEEASRAHLAKKAQLEAKQLRIEKAQLEVKQLRAKKRMERLAAAKSTFQEGARKRISLIRRSKSGKFTAQITDPITKRLVYLGTFATEEEATRAYLAKEAEFEAEKLRSKWRIDKSDLTSFQEGVRTSNSRVRRKKSGKYTAQIRNPITKRCVWIGTFATKVEAARACLAKEAEFEDEWRAKQGLARVASEKSLAPDSEIETSHLSNETGVAEYLWENKVSGEQEAGFGVFNGIHVVDKNGFLVGEFSMLDDFSICSDANS